MNILHHGFVNNTNMGLALIFVQGNLTNCAYFKILPRDEATIQVKVVLTNGWKAGHNHELPYHSSQYGRS
jgi:hypothetical protein